MGRQAVIALLALGSSLCWGEDVRDRVSFGRTCTVYRTPSLNAPPTCRGAKGTRVNRAGPASSGFIKVEMDQCIGFVTDSCLSFERSRWNSRRPAALVSSSEQRVRLGLAFDGSALFGRASGVSSSGYGLGTGLVLSVPLSSSFRLSLVPQYRHLQMSLSVDGTGVVSDTPGEFTHRIPHVGLGLYGSVLVTRRRIAGDPAWWIDGGAEYLFPLSARQVDRLGNEIAFETSDRPFFLVLGVSGDFWLSQNFSLISYLQGLYNLAASGESRVLAARFMLNFSLNL